MGNHAGNFDIAHLKWLGGLIDADGSIGISINTRKNNKIVYTPCIVITNSNAIMIERAHNILDQYKINHHIKPNGSCKNLTISRPNIIDLFCRLMNGLILVKNNELRLIHQFCLKRIININESGCNWKANYNKDEIDIVYELRSLNMRHYGKCEEYGIVDNEVSVDLLNCFSLEWLAGFIDGDGCFSISKIKRPSGKYQYQPLTSIVTGSLIAKNIISIYLDRYNINYYLNKSVSGPNHKPNCIKKKFEYVIRSQKDCIKIYNLLSNKVVGKKHRLKLLFNFCSSRLNRKNKPYSDFEIFLYKQLNDDIRGSSTTICKTSYDEEIV